MIQPPSCWPCWELVVRFGNIRYQYAIPSAHQQPMKNNESQARVRHLWLDILLLSYPNTVPTSLGLQWCSSIYPLVAGIGVLCCTNSGKWFNPRLLPPALRFVLSTLAIMSSPSLLRVFHNIVQFEGAKSRNPITTPPAGVSLIQAS